MGGSLDVRVADAERDVGELRGEFRGHEKECAVRYEAIDKSLKALWKRNARIELAAWSIVVMLLGFLAAYVFHSLTSRLDALDRQSLEAPAAAAALELRATR